MAISPAPAVLPPDFPPSLTRSVQVPDFVNAKIAGVPVPQVLIQGPTHAQEQYMHQD